MKIKSCDIPCKGSSVKDDLGFIICMAEADNYVMCRRPGFLPFVMPLEKWVELKKAESNPVFK